jgi:hypothetical protein
VKADIASSPESLCKIFKFFKPTYMLTGQRPISSESFILFEKSRCKLRYGFERSTHSLFYAIFALLMLLPVVRVIFMLIHYGFCCICFFYIKYSNIWKITNIFVKQYKKSKRARPDLESVEFFVDQAGPAGSNTELNWREIGPV